MSLEKIIMTKEQILLIKKTWGIFREIDPVLIGDVFYSKLFFDMPHLEHLFHTPKEEQSKKLVEMLSVIVGRLDRLEELTEEIKQLAIRHVQYGVKEQHYKAVGVALLWTLQQGLGSDWNEKVKEAWATCFQILSDTMIHASEYKNRRIA
ncbi:MAG TPA: globin domain-containing protein [Chitinophagaceae bacterium]|nr:globin domain-containing protein [Chitinophagaceae bacterium]